MYYYIFLFLGNSQNWLDPYHVYWHQHIAGCIGAGSYNVLLVWVRTSLNTYIIGLHSVHTYNVMIQGRSEGGGVLECP